jgi:hypothetical protein
LIHFDKALALKQKKTFINWTIGNSTTDITTDTATAALPLPLPLTLRCCRRYRCYH